MAAGETDYFGLGEVNTNNNIYLVKTDSNGNVQWSKAYGTASGNQTAFGHCLQPTTDGGYIVAGAASNQITQSDSGIFLMKIDASGNMKWSKYFSGCFGHAVKQTADGGYILAGTGNYGTTGNKVVLIKTDSLGVLQWATTYGGANTDNGWLLDIANDGGYVTGGWTESFGNDAEHIYFIKTDINGNTPCNETDSAGVIESAAPFVSSNAATQVMTGPNTTTFTPLFERAGTIIDLCSATGTNQIANNKEQMNIYPNPGSGIIHVDCSVTIDELKVTGIIGQLVYEATPNSTSTTLQLDNAGMYFITLKSGSITGTRKIIIIK